MTKFFSDGLINEEAKLIPLHKRKRSEDSLSDDYETPGELYEELCWKYNIHPLLDSSANKDNTKCELYITEEMDALKTEWLINYPDGEPYNARVDVWCNPPYSMTEEFVRRAHEQWTKHNINIMMLIPANTMSSHYWHECIEGKAEYHPIKGRIRFLVDGKPTPHSSRNASVIVIWRKK